VRTPSSGSWVRSAGASPEPMETANPWKPGRYLDPEIAASVKRAKERTRKSWRRIAKWTGVSHPHLVLISQGKRVPSRRVVQAMADLPFEPGEWERLYEAAVVGRGRDRMR
jgi:hypothetical protein